MNTRLAPLRSANALLALQSLGQSVWLDYIRRDLLSSGELALLIGRDGLRGLTSNPAIFEKALASGAEYAEAVAAAARAGLDPVAVYEALAIADIRDAADAMRPVYEATEGADGFVSLEVSPDLAHDSEATLIEARRLWRAVGRDNLMIKVPGTRAGVPAMRQLVAEGVNVNVTLLFARSAYEAVAEAYLEGLEALAARGGSLRRAASVASFFVSRIDTAVDALLEARIASAGAQQGAALERLLGKAAIANAKLAYRYYQRMLAGERWRRLSAQGARPQRLLWASTSAKNPRYRDVIYVEELIGPDTVNTMPPATLEAFRDHGRARATLAEGVDDARGLLDELERQGVSLEKVTDRLVEDGVALFREAFARLVAAIKARMRSAAAQSAH